MDASEFQFPHHDTFAFMFHPFRTRILRLVVEKMRAAASGFRLILAYSGEGRDRVADIEGVSQFKVFGDLALFRNF